LPLLFCLFLSQPIFFARHLSKIGNTSSNNAPIWETGSSDTVHWRSAWYADGGNDRRKPGTDNAPFRE
jgi:hypothetical protein